MIVDSESGMVLATAGKTAALDLEIAAAGNSEILKAIKRTLGDLRINDTIEDVLVTLGHAYHILRPVHHIPGIFFYVVIERSTGNLALARRKLQYLEQDLEV